MNYFNNLGFISFGVIVTVMCSVYSTEVTSCEFVVTDLKQKKIDFNSVCNSGKPCLVKCCGENEVGHSSKGVITCKNINTLKKETGNNLTGIPLDYSDLKIYQNDIYKDRTLSSKKFSDFKLLHSKIFMIKDDKCAFRPKDTDTILEKGTLVKSMPNHYVYWMPFETPVFCVDMKIGFRNKKASHQYFFKVKLEDQNTFKHKNLYTAIAMTISVFFLILVLIVYSVLKQLRNAQGKLLFAYVATLTCMYALMAAQIFISFSADSPDCTVRSQIIYFLILASFFWLKLMCFDIWWTFRGSRKRQEIHRRGINVKLMIYASYAYGASAAITIFAITMDRASLPDHVVKPFFNTCLISDTFWFYLYVPLMILTGCNCLMFLMTVYNIWLINRMMNSFDESTVNKNKRTRNRFSLYIKLCSVMGVAWILEFIQYKIPDEYFPVWLFVLINTYNLFIGVIIFFVFVFKTKTLRMLCKKFNIENKWTRRFLKINPTTQSEHSKVSVTYRQKQQPE